MEERSPVFNCQVQSLVEMRGQGFAIDVLIKTVRAEMGGGMMIADGSRRRTRGGTYIKLAKDKLHPEQRRELDVLARAKMKAHSERRKARSSALEAAAAELE